MAEIKKATTVTTGRSNYGVLFSRDNYMWMIIGAVVIIIGMLLMTGGKNADPNVFDTDAVYGTTRITIAPIIILIGFIIEIYAIFKKPALKH